MALYKRSDLILSSEMEKHIVPSSDPRWGPSYLPIHSNVFEKTASQCYIPEKIIKLVECLKPRKDGRYVHINAVGALSAWGCFIPGSPVLREDGRYLSIEEIRRGDRVLGRSGQFREVLTVWEHDHHRDGMRISVEGLLDDIGTTPNHEFLSLPFDEVRCDRDRSRRCIPETSGTQNICQRPQSLVCSIMPKTLVGHWVSAETLALKDFLLCALPEHDAEPIFTEEEARAIGLWVADGNFCGNDLEFSVADSELFLIEDIECLGKVKVYEGHGACKSVRVLRPDLVRKIRSLFGEYSHGKRIPGNFSRQPEGVILSLLSGYFDGDGSPNLKDSVSYAHTVSKDLALGIQRLLWSVRIPSTVCPAPGGYHVHFSLDRGRRLAERCRKFPRHIPKGRPSYRQFFVDDYVCLPIRKIERFKINGPVYDLEVEEEHAYNVAQVVCHNSNKNGDAFPKWSLVHDSPPADILSFLNDKGLSVPPEYGYETFETYAYPFVFHDNKDPLKSIGEKVTCAAYNDVMERVELIVFISDRHAPDLVRRIDAGDPIPWSMGCKVPFDVCSICKNAAKNRSEYCSHLRTLMNVTLPDGRKVYALNWFPRFFDISYVISPAWSEAWSLRKVASHGSPIAAPVASAVFAFQPSEIDFEKIASAQVQFRKAAVLKRAEEKAAEIEKQIPAEKGQDNLGRAPIKTPVYRELKKLVALHKDETPSIPKTELDSLKRDHPLSDILGGATACGIQLKKLEVDSLTDGDDSKLPDSLDFESPSSRILAVLRKWMPDRSLFDPPFAKRVIRIIRIRGNAEPDHEKRSSSSSSFNRYCALLREVDVDKLAARANDMEILEVRDQFAVDNSLAAVKTAETDERLRAVLPFVVGAGLHTS